MFIDTKWNFFLNDSKAKVPMAFGKISQSKLC